MTVRSRSILAVGLGLGLALPLPAREPGRFIGEREPAAKPSANQQTAQGIAEHLRQSEQLRGYTIQVTFQDGTAELAGRVATIAQRDEALRLARQAPGVRQVRDKLEVAPAAVLPVAATMPGVPVLPMPYLVAQAGPAGAPNGDPALLPRPNLVPSLPGAPVPGMTGSAVPGYGMPGPGMAGPGMPGNGEPMPIFSAPFPSPYDVNAPRMPPYAWPTYAPYNNYSRVAYPEAYPYQSWPFIGPAYPFPKVPLGWRSVKLEWQDGYWWYSRIATKHDWWRLRYW